MPLAIELPMSIEEGAGINSIDHRGIGGSASLCVLVNRALCIMINLPACNTLPGSLHGSEFLRLTVTVYECRDSTNTFCQIAFEPGPVERGYDYSGYVNGVAGIEFDPTRPSCVQLPDRISASCNIARLYQQVLSLLQDETFGLSLGKGCDPRRLPDDVLLHPQLRKPG